MLSKLLPDLGSAHVLGPGSNIDALFGNIRQKLLRIAVANGGKEFALQLRWGLGGRLG
jgi:hypothetical protein